ncbi:MAG: septal ring lytic transglycosylase RlpA family protein [Bacteroidota bacterium]
MISFKAVAIARGVVAMCAVMLACQTSPRFVRNGGTNDSRPEIGPEPAGDSSVTGTLRPSTGKALLTLEGVASYYAHDFHGKLTSNGETFDMNSLTAAHRTFPFGTRILVTNLTNNKTVTVRVNDRGPFVDGRIIDLSLGAAKEVSLIQTGTAKVRLEVLRWGDGK